MTYSHDYYNIKDLKYVGDKRAKLYNKLGIFSIQDLLYHCPRTYIDLSNVVSLENSPIDQSIAIRVLVTDKTLPKVTSRGYSKRKLVIYKIKAKDLLSGLDVFITLFNEPYTFEKIQVDKEYIVFGKVVKNNFSNNFSNSYFEISSPLIQDAKTENKFVPVYQLTAGLTSKIISTNIREALKIPGVVKEYLPRWVLSKAGLIDLNLALKYIHFPTGQEQIFQAKKRIVFDELFVFCLGLVFLRNNNLKNTAFLMQDVDMSRFYSALPFVLTDAQNNVINEIICDMKKNIPMNRLLQGDVGSGKTVVAMASIFFAYQNQLQSAFMAPTEILARQHFESLEKFMSQLGLKVGLLTGSLSAKQKRVVKQELEEGQIDVLVGTHAILQDNVVFKNLGLVVTDEQHRFGVKQRAKLSEKGEEPHKLIMSATPIPRTLSMIMYGDLDVSVIDVSPSDRKPILTYYINGQKRKRAYDFVKKLLDEGRQAYIVCPVIEQNDEIDLKSVLQHGQELKNVEFSDYSVEIIHGKTKASDKDLIMQDFQDHKIDVLISTTVIEVGIDVPNAAVILIEDAERFGLSQLHQLRGRVGRSGYQSYCVLISNTKSFEAVEKLKKMTKLYDGFKISEYDLEIRGPGDFFGNRQHGLPKFKSFNMFDVMKDIKLLKLTQDVVYELLSQDKYLEKPENKYLKILVQEMLKDVSF